MISKQELDKLVIKYETADFIKDDPIQFPHRYKTITDIELAGFITSIFSYGNRKIFINKLSELFDLMDNEPTNFIKNNEFKLIKEKNIYYRFYKPDDIIILFKQLSKLYNTSNGLSELFNKSYENKNIEGMIKEVVNYFYTDIANSKGYAHMLPTGKNCAMKRINMFLRWMVRKSCVDLGVWDFIHTSELLIPLDVHVARLSQEMGLIKSSSNTIKTVHEITSVLKNFDNNDPIKYDFALFGKGIEESKKPKV